MNLTDDDEGKADEDDLREAVDDLKKKDATEDRGDMAMDPALGHLELNKGAPEEPLPSDDDEN